MNKNDQIDVELLPVFVEEGKDTFPKIHELWQILASGDARFAVTLQQLKRCLHTLKGSARMIGANQLGQHLHEFESFIKAIANTHLTVAQVQQGTAYYDQVMQIFDHISSASVLSAEAAEHTPLWVSKKEETFIRVKAHLIDQLLNQSGEMAIVRSYVENEVQVLQQVIQELALHIEMLDKRVRHIQMQTDTQMRTLRYKEATEREFDWLEFDQFSYLQELTHQMASNVSDISALRKHLVWTMRNVRAHIDVQVKLNANLQSDIMSARMVMVRTAAERLQRLVRQVAQEVQKKITFVITGETTLVDRHMLTTMTTVFEHLIRNATVHGLETPQERMQQQKNPAGSIHLQVTKEEGEVIFDFKDDGRGISLPYVHQRAVALGLIAATDSVRPDDVLDIIAHPDFSTSKQVTELAGRGVGMDIVRAEVTKLGGRIQLYTTPLVGTRFLIHVPWTLTSMRVVLVIVGGQTYALPLHLVRHIVRQRDINVSLQDGQLGYQWMGKTLTMTPLNELLREPSSVGQRDEGMVLILKQDAGMQALLVDAVVGNHEVILKQLAPSWVTIEGIIGATILGSGQIVLIIQPDALLQRWQTQLYKKLAPADRHVQMPKHIMVVDDALTVRRVLKKLLEKEGYQVMLAKDGQDALLHLPVQHPDLMLLDVEMPKMDGFTLLREIRQHKELPYIPVIMMTSRIGKKHQQRAKTLGADAYLGKPYQQDRLLALIRQLLSDPH